MTDKSSSCSSHCQPPLPELKLYQAFIFSIPILFTLVLLLLFYMLYLRRRRNAWAAAHMMVQYEARGFTSEVIKFSVWFWFCSCKMSVPAFISDYNDMPLWCDFISHWYCPPPFTGYIGFIPLFVTCMYFLLSVIFKLTIRPGSHGHLNPT